MRESAYKNLSDLLNQSSAKYGDRMAVGIAEGISYTYEELNGLTDMLATRLYGSGVEKGDKIAIIGENSPHWVAAYFAIHRAGGVAVPVLTDFSGTEMYSIIEHAEASMVFITGKQAVKFAEGYPKGINHIVYMEDFTFLPVDKVKKTNVPQEIKRISPADQGTHTPDFPETDLDELAVLIYTSGTTGRSKGVMLTHDNLIFDTIKTGSIHVVVASDVFLSVLPLAHTFEATIGMLIPILNGASVHYIDRAPTASYLGPLLKKIRPTTMLTVPLIIEKIYKSKIKPGIQSSPVTRLMAKFGPTRRIVYRAAGKKLMDFFGGRMRFFGIGGAPLAPEVEKFLLEAKFPYAIGYGLTETAPMLAGFGPARAVFHSVGTVMEGVEIRIDNPDSRTGEGEIVAKGRNVMPGYYKNEEMTREVFTEDGFFRTGDLGIFDKNGILYIKGRLKNMILGANGENIYPEEIESVINEQEFVNESLVLQMKGKLVALVHLNFEHMEEKFHHALETAHDKQQILNKKAEEVLEELKHRVNTQMSKTSRLQSVILQMEPFEKTPTLKIKRFLYGI